MYSMLCTSAMLLLCQNLYGFANKHKATQWRYISDSRWCRDWKWSLCGSLVFCYCCNNYIRCLDLFQMNAVKCSWCQWPLMLLFIICNALHKVSSCMFSVAQRDCSVLINYPLIQCCQKSEVHKTEPWIHEFFINHAETIHQNTTSGEIGSLSWMERSLSWMARFG